MNIEIIYKVDRHINPNIYVYGFKLYESKNTIVLFYKRTNKADKLTSNLLRSLDEFSFLSESPLLHANKTSSVSTHIYEASLKLETDEEIEFVKNMQKEKVYLYWNGLLKTNFIKIDYYLGLIAQTKISIHIEHVFVDCRLNLNDRTIYNMNDERTYYLFLKDI